MKAQKLCSYSIQYVVVHITTMTKGKSMMGPGSDKNIESIKINLGAKQESACCEKVKKVSRKCIFRKVDANNSSYNYCLKLTENNI